MYLSPSPLLNNGLQRPRCYVLDLQTRSRTQTGSGSLVLWAAHDENCSLLIFQERTFPLKKKKKLIIWQKTLKILLLVRTVCP